MNAHVEDDQACHRGGPARAERGLLPGGLERFGARHGTHGNHSRRHLPGLLGTDGNNDTTPTGAPTSTLPSSPTCRCGRPGSAAKAT